MKKTVLTIAAFMILSSSFGQIINEKKNIKDFSTKPKQMQKAPKKVYIRTFKVYYQMIAEAEKTNYGGRQIGGGSYKGNATARMAVGVKGVEVESLQKMTDELYSKFKAFLTSEGLEIYTAQNLPPIEYYEGWEKIDGPHINEEQFQGYLMIAPEGYSYYVKKVSNKGKEKVGEAYQDKAFKISDQLDDMIVADVELKIPSIWLDASAKLGTAKVKGGDYLRLASTSIIKFQTGRFNSISAFPKASSINMLKSDIPINGVFSGEKLKTVATQQRTTVPSYASFFTVDNTAVDITNYVECENETYISKVNETMNAYLDLATDRFKKNLNGEK